MLEATDIFTGCRVPPAAPSLQLKMRYNKTIAITEVNVTLLFK